MRFPCTVSINTFKAYINLLNTKESENKKLNTFDLDWESNSPERLRILCVKTIAQNWLDYPIYNEIQLPDDKNLLLEILDVNLPLADVCAHIKDDVFWKRSFQNKWNGILPKSCEGKPWIKIFLEKYCSETIQTMKPSEYNSDDILNLIEICSSNVECLRIKHLQPSINETTNDHIPFNVILTNLTELKVLDLTFDVKNIGTNFYLGCSQISVNDIKHLVAGLEKCYELREIRICSSKLEPFMLKLIARALEKGCPHLESIRIPHCRIGDVGLMAFLDSLSRESLSNLNDLDLTNNFLSQSVAIELSEAIKNRKIINLNLRLNPFTSDGIAAIFAILPEIPIKHLNVSCCSIDETIEVMLLKVLQESQTVATLNVSTNKLNDELGDKISRIIKMNNVIKTLDIRNTGISIKIKSTIDGIVLKNKDK